MVLPSPLSRPPTGSRYWPFCSDEKVIPLLPDSYGRKGNFGLSFLALSKMALFHLIGWCHQIRIPFNYFHSPAVLCAGGGCYLQPPTHKRKLFPGHTGLRAAIQYAVHLGPNLALLSFWETESIRLSKSMTRNASLF